MKPIALSIAAVVAVLTISTNAEATIYRRLAVRRPVQRVVVKQQVQRVKVVQPVVVRSAARRQVVVQPIIQKQIVLPAAAACYAAPLFIEQPTFRATGGCIEFFSAY